MTELETWMVGPFQLARQPYSQEVAISERGAFLWVAPDRESAVGWANFQIAKREARITPPMAA